MQQIHPLALFRLSVLGPLTSREHLAHGELKADNPPATILQHGGTIRPQP